MDYKDVVKAVGMLTGDLAQAQALFGERGLQGWQIAKERGVKKYVFKPSGKVIWIVVGREREYILYPVVGYCQCDDFFFHVMEGKAYVCQHLIAQKIAEKLNMYDLVEERDEFFDTLMNEWREIP